MPSSKSTAIQLRLCGLLCALLWSLAGANFAAADVYRWVDASGVVNYGALPPEGVNATLVSRSKSGRLRTSTAASAEVVSDSADDDEMSPEQKAMLKDLEAAEQTRQMEVAKIRASNCEKSRKVLENLTKTQRIRVTEGDGYQRIIGEDERQERISNAQQAIAMNCQPG